MSYKKYGDLVAEGDNQNRNNQYVNSLVPHINSTEHKAQILSNNRLVVVDVFADWCGPCKNIAPKVAELYKKYSEYGVLVCKENSDLGLTQEVTGLPTFLFYKNGRKMGNLTVIGGNMSQVENNIQQLINY